MRIAILDDNQLDIDYFKARAESFLKKKGDRTYQISEYTSGVPLVDDVKDGEWFDLIVLDIILKDGENGIDVAYKLRGSGYSGSLMFWTAHAGYMRDAFDVQATQYVIKGHEDGRVFSVIDTTLGRLEERMLTVKFKGDFHRVFFRNIEYIESRGQMCIIQASVWFLPASA